MMESGGEYQARRGTLSARVVMAILLTVAAAFLWRWRDALLVSLGHAGFWLTLAAIAGALGALLSVISRTGRLKFDFMAGRPGHYLATIPHIFTGALCGLVVVLDIRTEDILSYLPYGMKPQGALILAGLAAAVLEQLASWILHNKNA
jgi:hypothetical protein